MGLDTSHISLGKALIQHWLGASTLLPSAVSDYPNDTWPVTDKITEVTDLPNKLPNFE